MMRFVFVFLGVFVASVNIASGVAASAPLNVAVGVALLAVTALNVLVWRRR